MISYLVGIIIFVVSVVLQIRRPDLEKHRIYMSTTPEYNKSRVEGNGEVL